MNSCVTALQKRLSDKNLFLNFLKQSTVTSLTALCSCTRVADQVFTG